MTALNAPSRMISSFLSSTRTSSTRQPRSARTRTPPEEVLPTTMLPAALFTMRMECSPPPRTTSRPWTVTPIQHQVAVCHAVAHDEVAGNGDPLSVTPGTLTITLPSGISV